VIAVDTSAIIAIFRSEPGAEIVREKLIQSGNALMSAANVLELQLVLGGSRAIAAWSDVEDLFRSHHIVVRPFDEQQLHIAREAVVRFGRGRHKARLNFGDCFAYALAKSEDISLLCTGTDFAATDVAIA
jgi:ribonuclease VapC